MSEESITAQHPRRIFDGHNDVLTKLQQVGGVRAVNRFVGNSDFHIDLKKCEAGGLAGGFFALWVESPSGDDYQSMMTEAQYQVPLPEPLKREDAMNVVMEQASILLRLQSNRHLKVCTTVNELTACMNEGMLAAIMHLEGCEAIDQELQALDVLYQAGLRSLGPVWSRPNLFGHGVPFQFPTTPDTGPGLTTHGKDLVRRCNELRILVDLSHLNEAGFHDVAAISKHPLVATHSNAHALCPHARNLTDAQLEVISDSGGVVGLNFASAFIREDGRMLTDVPLEQMLRHLDHLLSVLGESGVALGSDFDGAQVPDAIADCAGLPVLVKAMRSHGYGEDLIDKLCMQNWLDVLRRTWHA